MIAEQQVKIPSASITQKPFEEKVTKKTADLPRDRRKSNEEKKKTAADDIIASRRVSKVYLFTYRNSTIHGIFFHM